MRMKSISFLVLGILLISTVSAITCCERLAGTNNNGAWCQNVDDASLCATSPFESVSAYCESTSYCKLGTCILQQEGICMQNTPRKSCEERGGYWTDQAKSSLSQCQLGCCIIGDQAALVTEIACNRMSVLYGGIQTTFMSNINDEITCLANANPTARGACVFTKDNVKSCEMTTKEECVTRQKASASLNIEFHEGFLCSAPEFQTSCFKTQTTKCDGDDIYFVDSCGNLANIYDSAKVNDDDYWTKIQEPTCGNGAGNKNSPSCGNCNYLSGSMCQERGTTAANFGNYVCKDLDCGSYRGQYSGSSTGFATANNYPKHGETWCVTDNKGAGTPNSPGASSYRLMCYNGETTIEQCDTTRQKICSESQDAISGYFTGNCRVNRWQDCWQQSDSGTCEDANYRDCNWIAGYAITENGVESGDGLCVPNFAPGFDTNGNAQVTGGESCAAANSVCYVTVERGWLNSLFNPDATKWGCKEGGIPLFKDIPLINLIPGVKGEGDNCECLGSGLSKIWSGYGGKDYGNNWKNARESICQQMGDCGTKVNFIGKAGYPQTSIQVITNLTE